MLGELKEWLGAAALLISVGGVIYGWFTAGGTKALTEVGALRKQTREDISALKEQIDKDEKAATDRRQQQAEAIVARFQLSESRLQAVEADMRHMPDREQAHRLELAIEKLTGSLETLDERLTGRIEALDERLKPVAATSARIQNYLMEQAADK